MSENLNEKKTLKEVVKDVATKTVEFGKKLVAETWKIALGATLVIAYEKVKEHLSAPESEEEIESELDD